MNLEELKTEHPDVFAALVAQGVQQERERTVAHLTAGEMSGVPSSGLRLAYSLIKNGEDMSPKHWAHYLQAARAVHEIQLRNEDDDVVLDAITGASVPKRMSAQEQAVYDELRRLVGGGDVGDANIEDLGVRF